MAATPSTMMPIGTRAPGFNLIDTVSGRMLGLEDVKGEKATVVMFICNHCPYVKAIEDRILRLARQMQTQPVQFVAVCSNDASDYPEDEPDNLYKTWKEKNYPFPYLVDADQSLARSFDAVCTPDIFVLDKERRLHYRGRWDDSWKDEAQVQRQDLKLAIESLLTKRPLDFKPVPSMGCSIKWKDNSL